jgi:hypothetical protein
MTRTLGALLLPLAWSAPAFAKSGDSEGVPVHVTVLDTASAPVATAVIRHPKEADRHRVNAATGEWEAAVLYLPDGTELVFEPKMVIQFEISAPGYLTQIVEYEVKKRKNNLEVLLEPIDLESSDIPEPIIQFGRDRPREDATNTPAH